MLILSTLLLMILAFAFGSIPSGVIIAKWAKNIDPRTQGSHNPGATNVARLCGFKYGLLTLFCDVFKGALPVLIALYFTQSPWVLSLVALVAVFGHLKSPLLNFRGGKGVATLVGVLLPLVLFPLICAGLICLLVIWRSRYVSLGSLTLASLLPCFTLFFGYFSYLPLTLILFVIIFWTHKENIIRLAKGTEKLWLVKKD